MQPARLPKRHVRRTYTWIAPTHDLLAVVVEAKARRLALSWANVQDGESVLEVAVGTGLTFRELLKRNPNGQNEGLDLTPAMLRRAQKRAARSGTENYRLQVGDAYALPFPDQHFDLVMNSYMFDLLPEADFVPVLYEYQRVLKPGGRLVMMNMTLGPRGYHQVWETIYRICPPLLGGCRGIELQPAFQAAGFTNIRRSFVREWTFPSEIMYGERPD
ncbi:MAG: class I SAM-dependent methyltransferase [Rhodothermales bacterium]